LMWWGGELFGSRSTGCRKNAKENRRMSSEIDPHPLFRWQLGLLLPSLPRRMLAAASVIASKIMTSRSDGSRQS
jgi:hypothetical protein